MSEPEGRVVVVTGAGSGIGAAISRHLAGLGDRVVLADLDEKSAGLMAKELRASGATALPVRVDVADPASCSDLVDRTVDSFGRVDVLVNNAGVAILNPVAETSDHDWQLMLGVMLSGPFQLCRSVLPVMPDGGRIVNISSAAGVRGMSRRAAYGAIKGGVAQLTRGLAVEVGGRGITVNAIAPGPIETPMVRELHTDAVRSAWLERLSIKRYGAPEEIAAAVAFLASDLAGYITGQVLSVDGGFAAASPFEY